MTSRMNIGGKAWLFAVLMMAAGCSSLPTLEPDLALLSEPIPVNGAHGALSDDQSKAVIQRIKVSQNFSAVLDRHIVLEQALVDRPLVVGNSVSLLHDGVQTFKAIFDAVRRARSTVNVETYIIEDDEIGNRFADLLIEKLRTGVHVNLMYDSVGSLSTPKSFFQRMIDAGINVLEFNPVNPFSAKAGWNVNHRDHRKLVIVDGQIAFLGGVNISSVHSNGSGRRRDATRKEEKVPWRDTHLKIEGPVVADFQRMFLAGWQKQKGKALTPSRYLPQSRARGNVVVRAIGSAPDERSRMYLTLISAVRHAESTVWLTNAYFVPDPQLLRTLIDTARRGVDVRLILPSFTDSWLTLNAGRSHYENLLEAGVKIYERRNRVLHAKTAVIDGIWSTIGSTNLDWRSFLYNDEVNAVILSKEFADSMEAMYMRDISESVQITLKAWRERPLMSRVRESFAQLWQRGL